MVKKSICKDKNKNPRLALVFELSYYTQMPLTLQKILFISI